MHVWPPWPRLQTKMYGWLPDWFKHGDSFFGVHPEVKERLNHPEQARRGMYAKLEELKKMEDCYADFGWNGADSRVTHQLMHRECM